MAKVQIRDCKFCGKMFPVTRKHPNVQTCSYRCAGLVKRMFHDRPCDVCGAVFRPKREGARFCSRKCAGIIHVNHGLSRTREYAIWSKMLLRCYRENNDNYRWYGGRGTYVCRRWRESVAAFLEDMGEAPSGRHTLDRIDTLGHYTCGHCEECKENQQPANCRWATKSQQVRNAKNNLWYTHDGKTLILKDWARLLGLNYHTLWMRLFFCKMTFTEAISSTRRRRRQKQSNG